MRIHTSPERRTPALSDATLHAILQFDTCTIANAVERFDVRLRNEGFTKPGLRCVTGDFPRILGYAATCRVRSSNPPVRGQAFLDRTDWWDSVAVLPTPRIAVIEDLEAKDGWGSAIGEVHAAVFKAFHFTGGITNGAVRDIPGLRGLPFPVLARGIAVSHAYSHLVDFGNPVEIFGLEISSGDLLYADCHGVISIPLEIAGELPAAARDIRRQERRIIDLCQSPDFTPERLLEAIKTNP